ncbi:hypothetical protein AKJ57_02490 [candidate division MSBL1 archaeon SCGC-AAA259A05]|uniref:Cyclase n=1 Tax=candidate division MSBL1 archaeon SCGC-AAA259A05 TaxID=1698259 RepID=A0A133UA55_9EURY|nr:hypothetical protein AKJ57_02490 [candidate division MSBL1 archaeon SCGC-AAA259A05]
MSNEYITMFGEDYRIIDLSSAVEPNNMPEGRQFNTMRSATLPDGKDTEAVFTHTHVGTHVEVALHALREPPSVTDFPITKFMGEAIVLSLDERSGGSLEVDSDYLEEKIGDKIKPNDIVIWRNDIAESSNVSHPEENLPYFTPESAEFFIENNTKMVVKGNVKFGKTMDLGSEFEDQLHENQIPIVEIPDNLHDIKRERIFFMALPIKVDEVGSSWVRAVGIEKC